MIDNIKTLLGISDDSKDAILIILREEAEEFIKDYTHSDCLQESIVEMIVIYRYNRLSNIGLNSESYSGASFNYADDLPQFIYKQLNPKRKVRFV